MRLQNRSFSTRPTLSSIPARRTARPNRLFSGRLEGRDLIAADDYLRRLVNSPTTPSSANTTVDGSGTGAAATVED